MSNEANAPTETLTDDMIRALRDEAAAAGDGPMVALCDLASDNVAIDDSPMTTMDEARELCAKAITSARAMDDSKPLVRVVP